MKIVTAEEMYNIESAAEREGMSRAQMMENAGKNIVNELIKLFPDFKRKKICILCGKGNNGGDGLVAARYLKKFGVLAKVFILGKINEVSATLSRKNLLRLKKLKVDVNEVKSADEITDEIATCDIVIDAIFGTGFKGEIMGPAGEVVRLLGDLKENISRPFVISVDLPSGLNADTGEISEPSVRADWTFTLGLPKKGLFLYPGIECAGNISVLDIGIPKRLVEKGWLNLLTVEDISKLFRPRKIGAHKGSCGHIFVLAGSPGMTGAAALTSEGALYSGAGLVTLGIPESLNAIMEIKLTEVMTRPFKETRYQSLGLKSFNEILKFSKKTDVIAIGPGLSRIKETSKLILKVIKNIDIPMVIDADAIFALRGKNSILKRRRAETIITPHPGEMVYLTGKSVDEIQSQRIEIPRNFAQEFRVITVLKGARTVIASPDGEVWINPTGNPGMATGGAGDVLVGMIAALVGQGMSSLNASKSGVFLHGFAGDIAKGEKGEMGLIASDIISKLPQAFKTVAVPVYGT